MNTKFYKWPTTQEQRLHLTTADAFKIVFGMRCFNAIYTAVSSLFARMEELEDSNDRFCTSVRTLQILVEGRGLRAQIHASDDENRLFSTNLQMFVKKSNYFHFLCICDSIEHRTSYELCVFSAFSMDTY